MHDTSDLHVGRVHMTDDDVAAPELRLVCEM